MPPLNSALFPNYKDDESNQINILLRLNNEIVQEIKKYYLDGSIKPKLIVKNGEFYFKIKDDLIYNAKSFQENSRVELYSNLTASKPICNTSASRIENTANLNIPTEYVTEYDNDNGNGNHGVHDILANRKKRKQMLSQCINMGRLNMKLNVIDNRLLNNNLKLKNEKLLKEKNRMNFIEDHEIIKRPRSAMAVNHTLNPSSSSSIVSIINGSNSNIDGIKSLPASPYLNANIYSNPITPADGYSGFNLEKKLHLRKKLIHLLSLGPISRDDVFNKLNPDHEDEDYLSKALDEVGVLYNKDIDELDYPYPNKEAKNCYVLKSEKYKELILSCFDHGILNKIVKNFSYILDKDGYAADSIMRIKFLQDTEAILKKISIIKANKLEQLKAIRHEKQIKEEEEQKLNQQEEQEKKAPFPSATMVSSKAPAKRKNNQMSSLDSALVLSESESATNTTIENNKNEMDVANDNVAPLTSIALSSEVKRRRTISSSSTSSNNSIKRDQRKDVLAMRKGREGDGESYDEEANSSNSPTLNSSSVDGDIDEEYLSLNEVHRLKKLNGNNATAAPLVTSKPINNVQPLIYDTKNYSRSSTSSPVKTLTTTKTNTASNFIKKQKTSPRASEEWPTEPLLQLAVKFKQSYKEYEFLYRTLEKNRRATNFKNKDETLRKFVKLHNELSVWKKKLWGQPITKSPQNNINNNNSNNNNNNNNNNEEVISQLSTERTIPRSVGSGSETRSGSGRVNYTGSIMLDK
ncbi:hypothetical protein PACTADRAFT_2072 [Pachysolen tannophilus NRRL Y-2460]|uniref:Uncharacterized protein n=1 Tax=Pachysolen tannophilus NRRL Y-2460 TaxID=669874 RepID=A0A1E4TVI2_PACTA|nr:hypothetical protein PACTADRAFT_2072 [Pachysolen tannophilus NRRL Y-2460]